MYNFKEGDIIVRQYESGREAICLVIYVNIIYSHINSHIIYLNKSFDEDGGLSTLDIYGLATNKYNYRYANFKECVDVLKYLRTFAEFNSLSDIKKNNYDLALKSINLTLRKNKLAKLNSL